MRYTIQIINKTILLSVILLMAGSFSMSASSDIRNESDEAAAYSAFNAALSSGYRDKAADCAVQYLSEADSLVFSEAKARMAGFLGEYYDEDKFLFTKAIYWYQKALSAYEGTGNSGSAAWVALRLGKLRYKLGRYDKALTYVIEALPVFESKEDKKGVAECYNVLGAIYFACRNYQKSNYYASLFEKCSKELNDTALMVIAMNNMAVYANFKKDSIKSRTFISESISMCKSYGDSSMLCNLYLNLTASYLNVGNLDSAFRYLSLAAPLRGNIAEEGKYNYMKGVMDNMNGDVNGAETHLLEAIRYYSEGEFDLQSQKCRILLEKIYADRGDTSKAYKELSRYYETDSRLAQENVFIELFDYQNEIINRKEAEKATARKTSIIFYSLIIAFTVIIVIILLFLLHRTKAKNKAEMKAQKEILELKKMQEFSMNRLTQEVISRLSKIAGETNEPETRFKLMCISGELSGSKDPDQWKEMSQYIPEFNTEFYQKLIKDFPTLTTNERRLCALLNLNMSTKEIASMTRQTPHSIKVARYRLRSKLNLTGSKMTIQEFLARYNS